MKVGKEIQEGYSSEEMRAITRQMIDESMGRLRKRLRVEWKKQESIGRVSHVRHGATV